MRHIFNVWTDNVAVTECLVISECNVLLLRFYHIFFIRVQSFLAVQNSSLCSLILLIGVSYHVLLMYYRNYEHTGL